MSRKPTQKIVAVKSTRRLDGDDFIPSTGYSGPVVYAPKKDTRGLAGDFFMEDGKLMAMVEFDGAPIATTCVVGEDITLSPAAMRAVLALKRA